MLLPTPSLRLASSTVQTLNVGEVETESQMQPTLTAWPRTMVLTLPNLSPLICKVRVAKGHLMGRYEDEMRGWGWSVWHSAWQRTSNDRSCHLVKDQARAVAPRFSRDLCPARVCDSGNLVELLAHYWFQAHMIVWSVWITDSRKTERKAVPCNRQGGAQGLDVNPASSGIIPVAP